MKYVSMAAHVWVHVHIICGIWLTAGPQAMYKALIVSEKTIIFKGWLHTLLFLYLQ